MRTIKKEYDPKPIPTRAYDWEAYRIPQNEDDVVGYGMTALEATRDLEYREELKNEI